MTAFSMKAVLLALFVLQTGAQPAESPKASPSHLRYRRQVTVEGGPRGTGQACAVIDAQVFARAAPSLKDVRLFRGENELPYAVTLSESLQQDSEEARILNLGTRSGRIVFDLQMPNRPYTNVTLELAARDFVATATVSGETSASTDSLSSKSQTFLGSFTLFDLSSQRLSHSTSIPLAESSFPYLHIELEMSAAPGVVVDSKALRDPAIVKSATVPPSREAQTVYTTVLETASLIQRGRQSVASFHVPVHVPIERVSFAIQPSFRGNFSRQVELKANAAGRPNPDAAGDTDTAAEAAPRLETLAGSISRVHATEAGRELTEEQLSVPAAIGSNMQRPAEIEVAIDNGDDQPLPIAAVKLEMRQRRLCFDAAGLAGAPLSLDYGDADLDAPVYDYAKLFQQAATPLAASLGPETLNTDYQARPESRPFTERHPELLWIGLLGVVCILAITAIRSAKKLH